jgi:AraC-like DNA-binding protein
MDSTKLLPQFHHAGRFADRADVGVHSHPGAELVLVVEGNCSVDMSGQAFTGGPGTMFVVPSGMPHNQREHAFTRTHYVVFTASPQLFDDTARIVSVDLAAERWVSRWVDDLCGLSEESSGRGADLAVGILHALLERVKQIEKQRDNRRAMHPALVRALTAIERDPAATFTVGSLAHQAMVSPSYLTALFNQSTGAGPMQWVQQVRLERAQRLLGDPYLSVKQVGQLCGYDNANYFSRLFAQKTGQTPVQFRKGLGGSGAVP